MGMSRAGNRFSRDTVMDASETPPTVAGVAFARSAGGAIGRKRSSFRLSIRNLTVQYFRPEHRGMRSDNVERSGDVGRLLGTSGGLFNAFIGFNGTRRRHRVGRRDVPPTRNARTYISISCGFPRTPAPDNKTGLEHLISCLRLICIIIV